MMPDELAPWVEKHPAAPDGWEPLASLPITKYRAPIEYLLKSGATRKTLGVTNLDFVLPKDKPVAWRPLTEGPLYDWYWWVKERNANLVAAYG